MNQDDKELNDLLSNPGEVLFKTSKRAVYQDECAEEGLSRKGHGKLVQWTTTDDKIFVPSGNTKGNLIPGIYEIASAPHIGIYFHKIPVRTEGLLRFPQTNSEKVVKEIELFWSKESIFKDFGLAYKRGIILWGPAGGGKSCTVQLIMNDVIARKGIVLKFTEPTLFTEGVRILREIQPETPVVVLMEDIDSILEIFNESQVLNILDGVDEVQKAVFLATTNYPERLGPRIVNRPSRFDKRFKIDYPNAESRRMYLEHLVGKRDAKKLKVDYNKWVEDTDKFSLAHIKELFVAVVILGDNYKNSIETLKSMKEEISSYYDDKDGKMGFGHASSNMDYCN